MYNITLLSSFHMIHGKCNPGNLYSIIEEIQPDIIFEELPDDIFDFVYSDGIVPKSLEALTIKRYLQEYPIRHFPVDSYPKNEADLLRDTKLIEDYSQDYCELWNQNIYMIAQRGFSFLNSDECIEILTKIDKIEETVLSEINNVKLLNEYNAEKRLDHNREYEMLDNIYKYSKQYPYNQALFICGAEHRLAFVQKIQELEAKEAFKLK